MPLPTKASDFSALECVYESFTSRGGASEPTPTPRMPPKPPLVRAFSSSTCTLTPCSLPTAVATAAKAAGSSSFGGVLTRSRARLISSATVTARSAAALCALSRGLAPSRAASPSGPLASLGTAWNAVKAYAPSSAPSPIAWTSSAAVTGSAKAAFLAPASARAATPAARRSVSSANSASASVLSGTAPSPTARTTGALRPHGRGDLGRLALGAGGSEGLQNGGELSAERLVHGFGARCDHGALGALRHAYDDGVGAQRCGAGRAERRAVTVVKSRFR